MEVKTIEVRWGLRGELLDCKGEERMAEVQQVLNRAETPLIIHASDRLCLAHLATLSITCPVEKAASIVVLTWKQCWTTNHDVVIFIGPKWWINDCLDEKPWEKEEIPWWEKRRR